jgi:hypothetical protein
LIGVIGTYLLKSSCGYSLSSILFGAFFLVHVFVSGLDQQLMRTVN